jgi:hypothetical protein
LSIAGALSRVLQERTALPLQKEDWELFRFGPIGSYDPNPSNRQAAYDGIKGNSHMMMMDRNSDQIAELVAKWLEESRAD